MSIDYRSKGFPEVYKKYKKRDDLDNPPIENKDLAREVFESIIKKSWEKMIKNKSTFKPPWGFGTFLVVERDGPKMTKYIDWPKSKEKGERVWAYNTHSGGYKHGMYWGKCLCTLKNRKAYRIKFCRGGTDKKWGYRGLGGWVMKHNKDEDKGIYRSNIKPKC